MSENKKTIQDWIDTLEDKLSERETISTNYCTAGEKIPDKYFYRYFGDTPSSYDPAAYSFPCALSPQGLPTGEGTITRCKTWVWPKCSGFTSWAATERSGKLHSVEDAGRMGCAAGYRHSDTAMESLFGPFFTVEFLRV